MCIASPHETACARCCEYPADGKNIKDHLIHTREVQQAKDFSSEARETLCQTGRRPALKFANRETQTWILRDTELPQVALRCSMTIVLLRRSAVRQCRRVDLRTNVFARRTCFSKPAVSEVSKSEELPSDSGESRLCFSSHAVASSRVVRLFLLCMLHIVSVILKWWR